MSRKHYTFRPAEGAIAYAERYIAWKLDNKGGCGPGGFDFGIDQPTANRVAAMLDPLLDGIAAAGQVTPSWEPANEFHARRLAKAYTDRGLKAA